jgi:two-component sensor histidine kinase
VNELFTNCLKYAFPDGQKGEISIELQRNGDERFSLVIGDNGIGLPEDLDFRNTHSLELQLVNSLAAQFNGAVELDRAHGTEFTVTFMDQGL